MNRRRMIKNAITSMVVAGALTCLASVSMAATYYVATTGSDTNNGTATTTPFKTIQKSLDVVQPGDTVNIMAGTYNEALILKRSATSSARITIQPYNGASVTISSGSSRATRLNFSSGGYYTLSHLNFVSTRSVYNNDKDYSIDLGVGGPSWWGTPPAMAKDPVMDDPSYSPNMTMSDKNGYNGFIVEYCNIKGSIGLYGHNNIIRYNTMEGSESFTNAIRNGSIVAHHDVYTHNNVHGYVNRGVWLLDNINYEEVSYNTFSNNAITSNHVAVDFDCVPEPGHRNLLIGNVASNMHIAYQFENQFRSIMDGNIAYNCSGDGFSIIAYGADQGDTTEWRNYAQNNLIRNNVAYNAGNAISVNSSKNNFIINNTVDATKGSVGAIIVSDAGSGFAPNNNYIANNIVTNSNVGIVNQNGSNVTITNNLFYGNTNNGQTGSNAQMGNPQYTNATNHDYSIPATSPAVDKGTNPTSSFTDPYGDSVSITVPTDFTLTTTRPQGSGYDIGAYEYKSGTTAVAPSAPVLSIL